MVEAEFAQKAAQLHELAAADTSGLLALEVLPEIFGTGRQIDLLTCRMMARADRSGTYKVDGAANTTQCG